MNRVRNISYVFIALTLVLIAYYKMATPFLTVLFAYLALQHLRFRNKKWISITLFIILVGVIFYGFGYFSNLAIVALPKIFADSIPKIVDYAKAKGIELPFSDPESLKNLLVAGLGEQMAYLANVAKIATKEFVFLVIGLVVAVSIFINPALDTSAEDSKLKNNLFTLLTLQIRRRFRTFYQCFATVIGAQIAISGINATLTGIFVTSISLPYAPLIMALAFLVGLLPIVGNLISNTIIVFVAVSQSLWLAVASLIFLVVLHKLEYFLNSRIIGEKIKTPMWLTLISLIVGEEIMGIPGMILAPVILNYIKVESSQIEVEP